MITASHLDQNVFNLVFLFPSLNACSLVFFFSGIISPRCINFTIKFTLLTDLLHSMDIIKLYIRNI